MIKLKEDTTLLKGILAQEVNQWDKYYGDKNWKSTEMGAEIKNTIEKYKIFRDQYITFFEKNISQTMEYPNDWVVNKIFSVLFDYWEPIQRAAEQYTISSYKELLDEGFVKIQNYRNLKRIKEIPAVIYLEKKGKAKRFPLSPIYVIGIPLSDAYLGDWTAIPHELGHCIYWNSVFQVDGERQYPVQRSQNIFTKLIETAVNSANLGQIKSTLVIDIVKSWEEEIFAEITGVQIGSTQDQDDHAEAVWRKLEKNIKNQDELFWDDGQHPLPVLLPYIRTYAKDIPSDDEALDGMFGARLGIESRGRNLDFKAKRKYINLEVLKFVLKSLIQEIKEKVKITGDLYVEGTKLEDFLQVYSQEQVASSISGKMDKLLDLQILERNEFTCVLCKNVSQGTAGINPCQHGDGMVGSILSVPAAIIGS